jgi:hypothetical protein
MEESETTPDLTTEEMVEILKAIARDGGNAAARIAAIKQLRDMDTGEPSADDGFGALDGPDDLAKKRLRTKAA